MSALKNLIFGSKIRTFSSILVILLFITAVTAIILNQKKSNQPEEKISGMVFEVEVPKNTPGGDAVHIFFAGQKSYKMEEIGDYKFSINLSHDQIQPEDLNQVKYRYSRNGHDFNSAEYLEPDTNDYFWTEMGRTITYEEGGTQRDVIKRWRWFPDEDTAIVRTSKLTPKGNFEKRVNGEEFLSGQIIEDLFVEAYRDFFNSTASYMKAVGYNYTEIDPPWQWAEEKGLPVAKNLVEDDANPNYPDSSTLKQEILAHKNKGFKVALQPQLCCTQINTEDKSKKWWDAYFAETTKFLVHHAKIAEETNVDYFHYALGHEYWESDYATKWSNVFKEVRKHFSGKVGEMVWSGGNGGSHPEPDFVTWGNELDYFYIAIDAPISKKDNPTDEELKKGAEKNLAGAKKFYDTYKKPVFVRTTYFNVKKTWKGADFYDISSIPSTVSPEKDLEKSKYEFGPEDLARVVNAYFEIIAENPWVMGYAQFGYTHWENPLAAELSARGKPAEDIWKKWNDFIFDK